MTKTFALFANKNTTVGYNELWETDGTAPGTFQLLSTSRSQASFSNTALNFVSLGDVPYFTLADVYNTRQLWTTDGTSLGTVQLTFSPGDPNAGSFAQGRYAANLTVLGNQLVFSATDAHNFQTIWTSNGTAAGTVEILPSGTPSFGLVATDLTLFGTRILFAGYGASSQIELWQTDGTASGTTVVSAGTYAISPANITSIGTMAVFTGYDATGFHQSLWSTDGTTAGTARILSQTNGLNPTNLVALGTGTAVFTGNDAAGHSTLWSTDGTAGGTRDLGSALGSPTLGLSPTNLKVVATTAVFDGIDAAGIHGVWHTDGTLAGTAEYIVPNAAATGVGNGCFIPYGNQILFTGATGSSGDHGIWKIDTVSQTVTALVPSNVDDQIPQLFGIVGQYLFYDSPSVSGQASSSISSVNISAVDISNGVSTVIHNGGVSGNTGNGNTNSFYTNLGSHTVFTAYDQGDYKIYNVDNNSLTLTALYTEPTSTNGFGPAAPGNFQAVTVACFANGTQLATPGGQRRVETLAVGNLVLTSTGAAVPISWIGRTRIDPRRHPEPARILPVRVLSGAFAPGVPCRDLLLSPDHSVAITDEAGTALVPIHLLANGASIFRLHDWAGPIIYWHVELERHALVLAEGLETESYLDTGNRFAFEGQAARAIYPDFGRNECEASLRIWAERGCAPLLLDGARLRRAHAALVERAKACFCEPSPDPSIVLETTHGVLQPEHGHDGYACFILPGSTSIIRLRSNAEAPSSFDRAADDLRRLGLPLSQVCHEGAVIPLGGPGWGTGCHALEGSWCWTDGNAVLNLAPQPHETVFEVYWMPGWHRSWKPLAA